GSAASPSSSPGSARHMPAVIALRLAGLVMTIVATGPSTTVSSRPVLISPLMDRDVGGHPRKVLLPQFAHGVGPRAGAPALDRLDRVHLPARAVAVRKATLLDDAQQVVPVLRRYPPVVEPLVGQRQQPAQHQLGHRHRAEPGPEEARVD